MFVDVVTKLLHKFVTMRAFRCEGGERRINPLPRYKLNLLHHSGGCSNALPQIQSQKALGLFLDQAF